VKVGDLVKLKNLHKDWGSVGIITKIYVTKWGTGQIHLLSGSIRGTIPWGDKDTYLEKIDTRSVI
jgi:hypothetical protein